MDGHSGCAHAQPPLGLTRQSCCLYLATATHSVRVPGRTAVVRPTATGRAGIALVVVPTPQRRGRAPRAPVGLGPTAAVIPVVPARGGRVAVVPVAAATVVAVSSAVAVAASAVTVSSSTTVGVASSSSIAVPSSTAAGVAPSAVAVATVPVATPRSAVPVTASRSPAVSSTPTGETTTGSAARVKVVEPLRAAVLAWGWVVRAGRRREVNAEATAVEFLRQRRRK